MEIELRDPAKILNKLFNVYGPAERTLLAFSGGVDSTALFYLFLALKKNWPNFYFEVFHLDHGLRIESGLDADFVREVSALYQVPCWIKREDVAQVAREKRWSVEEAGRNLRYQWLTRLQRERSLDSITTAHHRDDQIEGFFLHLFKGAGIRSLAGMAERQNHLVRPLVSFSKAELISFACLNKLAFREDCSNQDNKYLRNQLRNTIYPAIKTSFPQFERKIQQFQQLAAEYAQFIQSRLLPWKTAPGELSLDASLLKALPPLLLKEQLLNGLKTLSADFYISFQNLQFIVDKLYAWDGRGHLELLKTKDFSVMASHGSLFVAEETVYRELPPENLAPGARLTFFDKTLFNESRETLSLQGPMVGARVHFDAGSKKLKDYLIDQKVFYHWRRQVYSIFDASGDFLGLWILRAGTLRLNKKGKEMIRFEEADSF